MRVLWLSNIQTVTSIKGIGCSWIGSLEAELSNKSDIRLGISFSSNQPDTSEFYIGNTCYFPIGKAPVKSKFRRIYARYAHKIESEDNILIYLDIIKKFKPDLIHIFGSESDYGLIISKTAIPCIIHIQGNLTVINYKWFSGFSFLDVLKYSKKSLLIKGHGLFHDHLYFKKAVKREAKICQECNFFLGRTDWDRRVISVLSPNSEYFHCDEIMRSGFYLKIWNPHPQQKDYTIFSTFKDSIYKGIETVFESKRVLKLSFPELNIIWKVAGIKETDEVSYFVERKFKNTFKNFNIQLLGQLQEDELIDELLKADLFVHASHIENSPNSVCEAMLLGMPVISTYAGGTPSILADKIEGLLVQDGDPYALAGAIIELMKDSELAKKLGENARSKSLVRNNPGKIVNDVLSIYRSVLEKNNLNAEL
jgi:glycosyltransferase involved in cell wall biosynthesis